MNTGPMMWKLFEFDQLCRGIGLRLEFCEQTGVSAATTATSARSFAILSAVLPSVHPSAEKPTTAIPTAPTTPPHTAGLNPG